MKHTFLEGTVELDIISIKLVWFILKQLKHMSNQENIVLNKAEKR